jgi:hypothetical protein
MVSLRLCVPFVPLFQGNHWFRAAFHLLRCIGVAIDEKHMAYFQCLVAGGLVFSQLLDLSSIDFIASHL